jgi:hypothetical protein
VHDCFDDAILERELDGSPEDTSDATIMTTWHSDELLSEALWFFVNSAFPSQAFEKTCREWVVASVDNSGWEEAVRNGVAEMTKP